MRRPVWLLAALAVSGASAAPARADGAIYAYVDRDGVAHYTNVAPDGRYQVVGGEVTRPERPIPDPGRKDQRGATAARPRTSASASGLLASRGKSAFDEHIRATARKYGLAPSLLKAVIAVESNFDPGAISVKGATGLMQLMPQTARDMYVYDIFDPLQNIEGGARYLRQLQDRYRGDLHQVLAAYNAGPERVRRSGGMVPAIRETQDYVRKVLGLYEAYAKAE
jgi:soluble lytic murein transglycosylase-like protein